MDDLTRINGIGKATAARLAEAGLVSFAGLAGASPETAEQLGLRPEWIAEAAEHMLAATAGQEYQGKPPSPDDEQGGAGPTPADGGAGDPQRNTQESSGTAREAPSTDSGTTASSPDQGPGQAPSVGAQPGSQPDPSQGDDQSGAGNPAGLAGVREIAADHPDRQEFPLTLAALEAWQAANPGKWPTIVRISSKRPGFRRANMDHPKGPTDHPAGRFNMHDMERLLAEPVLTVELV